MALYNNDVAMNMYFLINKYLLLKESLATHNFHADILKTLSVLIKAHPYEFIYSIDDENKSLLQHMIDAPQQMHPQHQAHKLSKNLLRTVAKSSMSPLFLSHHYYHTDLTTTIFNIYAADINLSMQSYQEFLYLIEPVCSRLSESLFYTDLGNKEQFNFFERLFYLRPPVEVDVIRDFLQKILLTMFEYDLNPFHIAVMLDNAYVLAQCISICKLHLADSVYLHCLEEQFNGLSLLQLADNKCFEVRLLILNFYQEKFPEYLPLLPSPIQHSSFYHLGLFPPVDAAIEVDKDDEKNLVPSFLLS